MRLLLTCSSIKAKASSREDFCVTLRFGAKSECESSPPESDDNHRILLRLNSSRRFLNANPGAVADGDALQEGGTDDSDALPVVADKDDSNRHEERPLVAVAIVRNNMVVVLEVVTEGLATN